MIESLKVKNMEHFDQNESTNNCATKYIVEFTGSINSEWLWKILDESLKRLKND